MTVVGNSKEQALPPEKFSKLPFMHWKKSLLQAGNSAPLGGNQSRPSTVSLESQIGGGSYGWSLALQTDGSLEALLQ